MRTANTKYDMKKIRCQKWNEEKIERLKLLYLTMPIPELAKAFDTTERTICYQLLDNNFISAKNKFVRLTDEQIGWLKRNYANMSSGTIALYLGMTKSTLQKYAHKYGLRKSKEFMSDIHRGKRGKYKIKVKNYGTE